MEWTQAKIYTTTAGADCVAGALVGAGVNGFAVEDAQDFEEFLSGTTVHWDMVDESLMRLKDCETSVTFYLPQNPQGADMLLDIRRRMEELPALCPGIDLGSLRMEFHDIDEEDWANEWKKYYHPTPVGDKLLVCPSWEQEGGDGRIRVVLNPGMAFGTGQHHTTRLCMELLEQLVAPGMKVFDVGCGSGILAVTGVLLGAGSAVGIDIDQMAAKIAYENAALNGVKDKVRFYCGDLRSTREQTAGRYEIVCMNIVADVIISLLEGVRSYIAPGGCLLLSGIIDTREQDVLHALEQHGYRVQQRLEDGGWVALRCIVG